MGGDVIVYAARRLRDRVTGLVWVDAFRSLGKERPSSPEELEAFLAPFHDDFRAAAERFIGEPDNQIETMVKNVLEGSLRSIAGTLTIEELITDRDRFQQAVSEAARGDLEASGIHIDALTITSIRDTKGYIEQLGEKNLASVQRDARIAKANASQEAAVKENEAQRVIIQAERDREKDEK